MFLIRGSADPLVPVAQSQEMSDVLAAAGVSHQLIILPGGTHNVKFPLRYANLIPQILAFLDESWNHKG
jgi:dipeptidyl aminopeptidase/acylaminoacyl peptidase